MGLMGLIGSIGLTSPIGPISPIGTMSPIHKPRRLPAPGDDAYEASQTGDCADIYERLPRVSIHHHQIAGLQQNVALRATLTFEIFFDVDPHRDAGSVRLLTENLDRGFFSGVGESALLGDGVEQPHRP